MWCRAHHPDASIGSDTLDRFQDQKELLGKHGVTPLVIASPCVEWIAGNSITYAGLAQ
jgi:hypothetical protein